MLWLLAQSVSADVCAIEVEQFKMPLTKTR
jgi:hypothetical protein